MEFHRASPVDPARERWLLYVIVAMGVCTPGGFLFLLALLDGANINFDKPVWFMLAAAGGGAGWWIGKRALRW